MDGNELLAKVREANPTERFAVSASGACVGQWVPEWDRFTVIYGKLLTGHWCHTTREVLIDGKPMVAADEWRE